MHLVVAGKIRNALHIRGSLAELQETLAYDATPDLIKKSASILKPHHYDGIARERMDAMDLCGHPLSKPLRGPKT